MLLAKKATSISGVAFLYFIENCLYNIGDISLSIAYIVKIYFTIPALFPLIKIIRQERF